MSLAPTHTTFDYQKRTHTGLQMMTLRQVIFAALFATCFAIPGTAQQRDTLSGNYTSGNSLFEDCRDAVSNNPTYFGGFCFGYVSGIDGPANRNNGD